MELYRGHDSLTLLSTCHGTVGTVVKQTVCGKQKDSHVPIFYLAAYASNLEAMVLVPCLDDWQNLSNSLSGNLLADLGGQMCNKT